MTTDTAAGIAAAVAAGRLTAGDAVETALARIATLDPGLNAFTDVTAARARVLEIATDEVGAVATCDSKGVGRNALSSSLFKKIDATPPLSKVAFSNRRRGV